MSICSSGGTRQKAGTPDAVALTVDRFESLLPTAMKWLVPFLPYLRPIIISDVAAFCGADPPGWPSLTGLTFEAVLAGGEVGAGLVAAQAIAQVLTNLFWYGACECASVATPAIPSPPAEPSGVPIINPPGLVAPGPGGPCLAFNTPTVSVNTTARSLLWGSDPVNGLLDIQLPLTPTSIRGVYNNNANGSVHGQIEFRVEFFNAAGTATSAVFHNVNSGATLTATDAIPAGTRYIFADTTQTAGGANLSDTADAQLQVFCSGATSGTPSVACCPPDPIMMGIILQIQAQVDLIQRQAVPFAYLASAVHSGLSGAGTLAIQGLIGVKVSATTIPSQLGSDGTSPVTYFDMGFLTFGSADGYPQSVRLERDHQLLLPARCSAFTVLAYDLHPGVVVDITELIREP